eukprot:g16637.t1
MPGASDFKVQDLVYAPCEKEVLFTPGVVVEVRAEDAVVQVADDLQTIPLGDLRRRFIRDDGATCSDNTSLVHLNDATILENLKARHEVDEIYTYTASVLLAVNPYKDVTGLYGESQCLRYRGKHIGALPPHPYAIADTAYRALVRDRKNQGFIISGESGAGKTETAKIVMEYLGYVSGSCNQKTEQIQRRVEQAQPILESFGNAYNRVFFDEHGILVDASVTTYLLESSRVVVHARRERTYHCFYEMLRGLPDEKLSQLHLEREKLYLLLASDAQEDLADDQKWHSQFQDQPLRAGLLPQNSSDRDAKLFHKLCGALSTVGFSGDEIDKIFQVLAGLVHLGDLSNGEKDEGDEAATVQLDQEILNKASALLGMDSDELGGALRRRRVRVTHAGRESLHEVPRTTSQFRHALHSLIKALYKRLFERLVQRINSSFGEWRRLPEEEISEWMRSASWTSMASSACSATPSSSSVSIWPMSDCSSTFTAFCRQGLPWIGLELPDSTPVVSAIVQTFKTLDEYSQQLAKGFEKTSDEGFCQKTVEDSQKDLNNDRLLAECEDLICTSSFDFVASLGEADAGKVPFRSISKKYCADLENLLETLNTCHLHYIRCFKPNEFQKPAIFSQTLVLDQLVQCGTIELVKIMHDGYPNRSPFNTIVQRFRDLLPESFQRYGMRTFIEALMLAYEVPEQEWALGMSRLFLKAGQLKALEDMRSEGAEADPERLKAIVHSIIRKKWVRAKNAIQLCLYLPRFLAELRTARALRTLCTRALLVGRLQPMLLAAREKLRLRALAAQRRWRVWGTAAYASTVFMKKVRDARQRKLANAFSVAWLLHKRLIPLANAARQRLAAEAVRREAERRREEERRAAEAGEADRREAETRAQYEEEIRRMKKDLEDKKLRTESEEDQRFGKDLIADVASPCRNSPTSRQPRLSLAGSTVEDDARSTACPTELDAGPSWSQYREMQERVLKLEQQMAERQNETREEMLKLLHNCRLAQQDNYYDEARPGLPSTPPRDRPPRYSTVSNTSCLSFDERRKSFASLKKVWGEQRKLLMVDLYPNGEDEEQSQPRTRRSSVRGDPLKSLAADYNTKRLSKTGGR